MSTLLQKKNAGSSIVLKKKITVVKNFAGLLFYNFPIVLQLWHITNYIIYVKRGLYSLRPLNFNDI